MKNKGFSLLEVVVSVVILSVGIIVLMQSFMYTLSGVRRFEKYRKAAALINLTLTELELNGTSFGRSNKSYTEKPYQGFNVEINTSEGSQEILSDHDLAHAEIIVRWQEKNKEVNVKAGVYAKLRTRD
ncbi:MAG: prepilin-type N-terminal cleavage/methylation domain-containing protein [Candidatus Omnitrophota bacterium]